MTPQFGCVGLCSGDGCEDCVRLADRIRYAKRHLSGPVQESRLAELAAQVANTMGVRS